MIRYEQSASRSRPGLLYWLIPGPIHLEEALHSTGAQRHDDDGEKTQEDQQMLPKAARGRARYIVGFVIRGRQGYGGPQTESSLP